MGNDKKFGVYIISNLLDGKVYVGSSVHLTHRMREHFTRLKSEIHQNIHLQRAFIRDGKDSFSFDVVEEVEDSFWLRAREHAWILRLQSTDDRFGYNMTKDAWSPLASSWSFEKRSRFFKEISERPEVKALQSVISSVRFQDHEYVAAWRKARREKNTMTRANNTRYKDPTAHQKTAEAAKKAHIAYHDKYCAGQQHRQSVRLQAYLQAPKLCKECSKPLIPREDQFLCDVIRFDYCGRKCSAIAREKRRKGGTSS